MSDFDRFKPEMRRRTGIAGLLQRISLDQLLIISVLIAAAFLAAFIYFYPAIARTVGMVANADAWSLMEGFMSLVTLAILVGGGIFALAEYIESESNRKENAAQVSFSLFQQIFDQLMDPDEIAARRWIIRNIPRRRDFDTDEAWILAVRDAIFEGEAPGSMSEGHRCVKQVLNTFDYIGFVARNYWDLEGPLIEWMSPPITKVWELIGPYIEEEALRRNEPDYYVSARFFGRYCTDWRSKKNLPETTYVDRAL